MKGKTSVYTLFTAAVLALLTLVGTPQTYANNWEVHPGEMCMKWSGAGIPKYYYGGIGNTSTTDWLYLDCPVIQHGDRGPDAGAMVDVRDVNPSYDTSCTLVRSWNAHSDGSYYTKSNGTQFSAGFAYTPQTLWLSGPGVDTTPTSYSQPDQHTSDIFF